MNTLYGSVEVRLAANNHGIRSVVDKTKPGALISAVEEELLSAEATSQPSATSDETSEILAPPMPNPVPDVAVTGTPVVQGKAVEEPTGTATPSAFKTE